MLSERSGARGHATVAMMTTADGAIRGLRGSMPMAANHPTQSFPIRFAAVGFGGA